MSTLPHYTKALKQLIVRFLPSPAKKRPNLNQLTLLRRIAASRDPALGEQSDAKECAVGFFAYWAQNAGFLSLSEVAGGLAGYFNDHTIFREGLLRDARRWCDSGLPVYDAEIGRPLADGRLWEALTEKAAADKLYLSRAHRFGFLPRLSMAAHLDAGLLPAILTTLEAWISQAEKGHDSAPYFSNLVVIYRLLAISWAAPFWAALAIAGNQTAGVICLRLFQILAADVQHLLPRLGRSKANNHLLADRFAAWFLAACFPELCPGSDPAGLEPAWIEELGRQFLPDGSNFEQSIHYHELGCELVVAYLVVSLRLGRQPDPKALALAECILRFQAVLSDPAGGTFSLGDATDDPLFPLDAGGSWGTGAWRDLYRALFDPAFPPAEDPAIGVERGYWLLKTLERVKLPLSGFSGSQAAQGLSVFPDNGYCLFDGGDRQRFLLRTGPAEGVEISPGHAMSDLLGIYWSVAGQPVLEPSGTYSYATVNSTKNTGPINGRDYFRGPAAHNGLVLAGHDPLGQPEGRFRQIDVGTRVVTSWRAHDPGIAWAEGRLCEKGPLDGYRRGLLRVDGNYALVFDCIPDLPNGSEVFSHWQFAPEAEVRIEAADRIEIEVAGIQARLSAGGGAKAKEIARGRADPAGGWISRRYGRLEPACQLICELDPAVRDQAYLLALAAPDEPWAVVHVVRAGEGGLMADIARGARRDIVCIGGLGSAGETLPIDLEFEGEVLWLRTEGARCLEVRALGLSCLKSKYLSIDLAKIAENADLSIAYGDWCQGELSRFPVQGEWQCL